MGLALSRGGSGVGRCGPDVRRRFERAAEAARRVASFCTAAVLDTNTHSTIGTPGFMFSSNDPEADSREALTLR